MSKHTPGPWHVNTSQYYLFIDPVVAVIERKLAGQDEHDMHDARLIAAAPELLEALRMWLHLHEAAAGYEGKYGKELDAAIAAQQIKIDAAANASRAAIAKATGEKA